MKQETRNETMSRLGLGRGWRAKKAGLGQLLIAGFRGRNS